MWKGRLIGGRLCFGSEQFLRGMWEHFSLKRAWVRKTLADAAATWVLPSKKFWSKPKRSADTDCGFAKKFGN